MEDDVHLRAAEMLSEAQVTLDLVRHSILDETDKSWRATMRNLKLFEY